MKVSIVALLAVLIASLSGCTQGGAAPVSGETEVPAAPPAKFDENSGGIEGTVFDEEGAPVPNVQVAVQSASAEPLSAATDVTGRFSFSNLAPGTHQVFASALGYESAAKAVQVVAGESSPAQFVLIKITVIESYYETIPFKGFFDCTWVIPLSSGPCGYVGTTNGTTGNPMEPLWVNSKRKWNYPVGPGVMSVLHDLTWTPGSFATGTKMAMTLSHGPLEDGTLRPGGHWFCNAAGTNPASLHWEREDLEDDGECLTGGQGSVDTPATIDPEGMMLQSFVSTGAGANPAGGDLPIGAAYQQPFELYVSVFYGTVAPDGFSALVDG